MTTTMTPHRSSQQATRDGFAQLLRAEWTKFRTVRGWVLGMVAAVLLTAAISLLSALGSGRSVQAERVPGTSGPSAIPVGPDGEAVSDSFYLVHQPLDGNGSITVRVTSLTGALVPAGPGGGGPGPGGLAPSPALGTQPWAKAGVIIKASTRPGSPYAAIMVTPGHGVRMQYNFIHDTAGSAGAVSAASPRWLRLTRSGDTLTGYESADGTHWTRVGTASLAGLPSTVQAGLFAASPDYNQVQVSFGSENGSGGPTQATAVFDHVSLRGAWPRGTWSGGQIGGGGGPGFRESAGTFTVAGSGEIAPVVPDEDIVGSSLKGVLVGLLVVIALGALFITSEYRRGMIRTTFAASPRRGRVLVAKAIVLGCVTFAAGLPVLAVVFPIIQRILRSNGFTPPVYPVLSLTGGTGLRLVAGTAALLAVTAILALAVGTMLRRSAAAVAAVLVLIVVPFILAAILPPASAQWLLRLTPAAAFAIQRSLPQYPQVASLCLASHGCYPLAPWAGFAVLCGYAAAALGLAVFLLRRRDV